MLLLARLLQQTHPAEAEALRRSIAAGGHEALLARLEASGAIERLRLSRLADFPRRAAHAVCLLRDGRWLLTRLRADGRWLIRLSDGSEEHVGLPALAALLPCDAFALRERAAGSADAPSRLAVVSPAGLRLVAQVLGLAVPVAMMLIVDKVVAQGAQNTLMALLVGVTLLTAFQYLFTLCHTLGSARAVELRALRQRQRILRVMLGSSRAPRWSAAGWQALQGASEAARFDVETRPQCLADGLYVALLAILMAAFSPMLLAVSALFVPLYVLAEGWPRRRSEAHAGRATRLLERLSTRYFEAVAEPELIHGLDLQGHLLGQWRQDDLELAAARYRLSLCRRLSALAVEFLQKLSLLLVMLLGVGAVIAGAMTLGQYIAFNLLSMQLAQPVLRLAAFRRAHTDVRAQAEATREIEQSCRRTPWPGAGGRPLDRRAPPLFEARGLRVREQAVAVELMLRSGAWLGVVGASGCGKTTLLRTLSGSRAPWAGELRLSGVPLHELTPAARSAGVRLVPQGPVVFSTSIAENIRLGDPAAHPRAVAAAASICGLEPLLARLPDHLNTVVGSAGHQLSGGERQRIALARAIVCRPLVLLLDEATAALDAISEAELLAGLRAHLATSVVVVVSHRASSLRGCQQILRLDGGRSGGALEGAAVPPLRVAGA